MAELLHRRWEPRFAGLTRRDRQGCNYDAYLPDPLDGWDLTLPGDLAAESVGRHKDRGPGLATHDFRAGSW